MKNAKDGHRAQVQVYAELIRQDFVDLSQSGSAEKLRNDIIALTQMPAYQSCRYCWDSGVPLPYSGEQGTDLRYKHLLKKNDFNNIQF